MSEVKIVRRTPLPLTEFERSQFKDPAEIFYFQHKSRSGYAPHNLADAWRWYNLFRAEIIGIFQWCGSNWNQLPTLPERRSK